MRRWVTVLAVATATVTALAGCLNPDGVDGDLTDDWARFAKPVLFVPAADTCHGGFREVGYLSSYQPVDCGQAHLVETLHVGTFTGEHANRETPPPAGSPGVRAAHGECAEKVTEVLGADWRTGRLKMAVVLPSDAGWTGGARWFRCDVGEIRSLDDPDFIIRPGSLKGALRGQSKLVYGCFKPELSDNHVQNMVPVACTKRHRAEFVGIYLAPDTTYEQFESNSERTHRECRARVASYVKVPNDSNLKYRTGTITYYPNEEEWEAGNRGVQCFLWNSDRDLTRSVKGAGPKGLPVD